jgi:hypothetical protein
MILFCQNIGILMFWKHVLGFFVDSNCVPPMLSLFFSHIHTFSFNGFDYESASAFYTFETSNFLQTLSRFYSVDLQCWWFEKLICVVIPHLFQQNLVELLSFMAYRHLGVGPIL